MEGSMMVLRVEVVSVYQVQDGEFKCIATSLDANGVFTWLLATGYTRVVKFSPDDGVSGLYQKVEGK